MAYLLHNVCHINFNINHSDNMPVCITPEDMDLYIHDYSAKKMSGEHQHIHTTAMTEA